MALIPLRRIVVKQKNPVKAGLLIQALSIIAWQIQFDGFVFYLQRYH
jgi:hypothetical protein